MTNSPGFDPEAVALLPDLPHPERIDDAALATWCTKRLTDLWPIHRWLVDHVAQVKR